jgi:RNA polymerase sigma factor (sigma-70 family)
MKESSVHTLSDANLLERYRTDLDARWLGELFERYRHLVFGLSLKYLKDKEEAKDATNGVFEKLISADQLPEINVFEHWIYTVSKNYCLMKLRSDERRRAHIAHLRAEGQEQDELTSKEIREADLVQLEQAIGQLSEAQRLCITKFYLEEKTYKEVSDETHYSMNEVKSYLQNGKRNLKLLLTKRA